MSRKFKVELACDWCDMRKSVAVPYDNDTYYNVKSDEFYQALNEAIESTGWERRWSREVQRYVELCPEHSRMAQVEALQADLLEARIRANAAAADISSIQERIIEIQLQRVPTPGTKE